MALLSVMLLQLEPSRDPVRTCGFVEWRSMTGFIKNIMARIAKDAYRKFRVEFMILFVEYKDSSLYPLGHPCARMA
jgi:hypothetical protein